ncbi:UDP-N-acetylglucosamine 2-epimerase (non-hydrolyzing) [Virgibacillus dakarensis]|uniref:UDP-N-acetyl glucosamine 2-epimerase n=1 Tax=Lentibacillus populi TaxID=1827502 RepID=A0A9W5X630_9BACI|nr:MULTISPECIES: UDP-N-acetylglucosamine 2-epimerase (non-hydrolyzing) [Bacillaceae]MTW87820.1 UDP-N-acetylglucosamine 2-epimerase (non-hydrolyzing) [Virgibacillus dakarensis]GGB49086.1 UDP-N-acetyl glucosamine 2-epimerase [Lentibacillus populi]
MKILTVIGARPQFIKACMLSRMIRSDSKMEEIIVHTGQHYDDNMSAIFFNQLKLPKPDYYLGVGSGSHGKQTGKMLMDLEKVMLLVRPDIVLLYGDTNSTLAGSLTASKLHIPIAHVESGLRSFNKSMPEEINRIVTDHLSDWLFCPSNTAIENLKREGIEKGVYLTGDIMYDAVLHFKHHALKQSSILNELSLSKNNYYLATIHRGENTDDPERLKSILEAFQKVNMEVVLPLHPRTKSKINQFNFTDFISSSSIKIVEPLHYFDMLAVASQANAILTDSGGLQKEAYMLQVPCITLRDETEWVETVMAGWNHLVGTDTQQIVNTVKALQVPKEYVPLFGDGSTSKKIVDILMKSFGEN